MLELSQVHNISLEPVKSSKTFKVLKNEPSTLVLENVIENWNFYENYFNGMSS